MNSFHQIHPTERRYRLGIVTYEEIAMRRCEERIEHCRRLNKPILAKIAALSLRYDELMKLGRASEAGAVDLAISHFKGDLVSP